MSEPSLSIPSSTFDYHQVLPAPEGPPPRPRYWVHVLLLLGTLGAVTRIKAPIRSRTSLFDIGVAGPIAGFVMAVASLVVAIMLSKPVGRGMASSELQLGYPAIFHIVQNVLRYFAPNRAV